MAKRRTHSTMDLLPAALRETVTSMIVDGAWPEGFPGEGKPRYEDMVEYCKRKNHKISRSAMGRFAVQMRVLARMRTSAEVVRGVMKDLTGENALQTQKAVAEIITAQLIEVSSEDNLKPKDLLCLAASVKDCTAVAFRAEQYQVKLQKQKAAKAADKISSIAKKKNIDPETLKMIREQIYGIVE